MSMKTWPTLLLPSFGQAKIEIQCRKNIKIVQKNWVNFGKNYLVTGSLGEESCTNEVLLKADQLFITWPAYDCWACVEIWRTKISSLISLKSERIRDGWFRKVAKCDEKKNISVWNTLYMENLTKVWKKNVKKNPKNVKKFAHMMF